MVDFVESLVGYVFCFLGVDVVDDVLVVVVRGLGFE